jgi:glycosyltransferase involved in cell wall biosynthesis
MEKAENLIRVLIIYHHLPHYRYDVFRELEDDPTLEVEFVAATRSRDGSIPTIPADLFRTFHPVRNHWIGPVMWQSGLLGILVRRRPDVVVFLGDASYLTTWLGSLLSRALGSHILFWTIGWHKPDASFRRIIRIVFYRLADKLLLYGDAGRAIGLDMGFPDTKMSVIYNSSSGPIQQMESDSTALAEFAAKLPPGDRPVATAVIRLNPVKRLDLLVEAAGNLKNRGTDVDVLLVGQGPELAQLTERAHFHGVRLFVPGPAYGDAELGMVYDVTDITVVPSAAGLTVLQSLKFGRPVITDDDIYEQMPESEAIIPGRTGDYFRHGDLQSLTDVMELWLVRRRESRSHTAEQCMASLEDRWSPHAQYLRIRGEIDEALHSRRRN